MSAKPTIELDEAGLRLTFPCGHSLRVSLSEDGLRAIHSILVARASKPAPRFAEPGLPVQSMLDAMVRSKRAERVSKQVGVKLDLSDIEL